MTENASIGHLEQAVLDSVRARGEYITGADKGAVEMALAYARQIDRIPVDAGHNRTKALYLGPHLMKALAALGCTPESRGIPQTGDLTDSAGEGIAPVVSVLDRMKAERSGA